MYTGIIYYSTHYFYHFLNYSFADIVCCIVVLYSKQTENPFTMQLNVAAMNFASLPAPGLTSYIFFLYHNNPLPSFNWIYFLSFNFQSPTQETGSVHDETSSSGNKDDDDDEEEECEEKIDPLKYDPERLKAFNVNILFVLRFCLYFHVVIFIFLKVG